MAIPVGAIAAGAAAGIAADKLGAHVPDPIPGDGHDDAHHNQLLDGLAAIEQAVRESAALLSSQTRPPVDWTPQLDFVRPYQMHTQGRPYSRIWLPAAITLSVDVPGVGPANVAYVAGWNLLDVPDQTILKTTASGVTANCLIRCTDHELA